MIEAFMPTIKKHNNMKTVQQRTAEGTAARRNNRTMEGLKCTNHSRPAWYLWHVARNESASFPEDDSVLSSLFS